MGDRTDINQRNIQTGNNSPVVAGDYYSPPQNPSRLEDLFGVLSLEIDQNVQKAEIIDALLRFTVTDADNVIGLEGKLSEVGLEHMLNFAEDVKECIAKKLMTYEHYPSAQEIFALLFSRVYTVFYSKVYPCLSEDSYQDIPSQIYHNIVEDIVQDLDSKCPERSQLYFNHEEISGLVYFLAGKCKIRFKR